MAALLWAGPASFASHRSAARVHGLDGTEAAPIEISLWTGRRRQGVVVHRLRVADRPSLRVIEGFRVSVPERTLLELAAVLPTPRVGEVLDEALRRRLTTLPRLRGSLEAERASGRDGVAGLTTLLAIRQATDPHLESELERRLFRLLRRAGLPKPLVQHEVRSRRRLIARLDFAYPELRLGIETHGYRWHGGARRWRRDIARENALRRLGWVVFVFAWDDVVGEPDRVVRELREALASHAPRTRKARPDRTRAG
jgi:very-short-patch-repair endonuclease